MDVKELGHIFDVIDNLEEKEKNILASFELRMKVLYDHKIKVRMLLSEINNRWSDGKKEDRIIILCEDILKMLQRAFISFDLNTITLLPAEQISENEEKILRDDVAYETRVYHNILRFKEKEFPSELLKKIKEQVMIDNETESAIMQFKKRIAIFRLGYTEQKKNIEDEIRTILDIKDYAKNDSMMHVSNYESLIREWNEKMLSYVEQIDALLKYEKKTIHEPFELLFQKTYRSRELSEKLFSEYWGDTFWKRIVSYGKSEKIINAIKRDVQTFSKPEEYSDYYNRLVELFRYGFPKNKKVLKFLHRLNVSRTNAERGKTSDIKNLERLASVDFLTNISNKRQIEEFLENETNRAIRNEGYISVLMIDIDKFKSYNDTFGHHTGDIVLKSFAKIVKDSLRKNEVIGRWGGEEFLVVLTDTSINDAKITAERIRKKVYEDSVEVMNEVKKTHTHVSNDPRFDNFCVSIGVASYPENTGKADPKSGLAKEIASNLKNFADKALYKAKETGRNKVVCYTTN